MNELQLAFCVYGWLTAAAIACGMAKRYERDEIGWTIFGSIAGPLALGFLYACGPKKTTTLIPITDEERRRWRALLRLDKNLDEAAKEARTHGVECERDLIVLYFAANDRRSLPFALQSAIAAANIRSGKSVQRG